MVVLRAIMYPQGRQEAAYPLGVASLTFLGQAKRDEGIVRFGERAYSVKLFKAPEFGGPMEEPEGPIWKQGIVRGHFPPSRGVWDLVGGALKSLLGSRIDRYQGTGFRNDVEEIRNRMTLLAESPECPEEWRSWLLQSVEAMGDLG